MEHLSCVAADSAVTQSVTIRDGSRGSSARVWSISCLALFLLAFISTKAGNVEGREK